MRIYHDLSKAVEKKISLIEFPQRANEGVMISGFLKSGAEIKVQLDMAYALVILIIGAAFGFWGAKLWDK